MREGQFSLVQEGPPLSRKLSKCKPKLTGIVCRVSARPHQIPSHRICTPELHRLKRIRNVSSTFAHFEFIHRPMPVSENIFRKWQVESHENCGKIKGMESSEEVRYQPSCPEMQGWKRTE